ncbi:hypothetical protein ACTQ4L_17910, partial [Clostridium sporogenes]|uniref:hypothetical protein n=1 Tax=Clostridium sporogenes TaxID=1509 RepID=UPI003F8EBDA4
DVYKRQILTIIKNILNSPFLINNKHKIIEHKFKISFALLFFEISIEKLNIIYKRKYKIVQV